MKSVMWCCVVWQVPYVLNKHSAFIFRVRPITWPIVLVTYLPKANLRVILPFPPQCSKLYSHPTVSCLPSRFRDCIDINHVTAEYVAPLLHVMEVTDSNLESFIIFLSPFRQMLEQYRWWQHFSSFLQLLLIHTTILPLVLCNPSSWKTSWVTQEHIKLTMPSDVYESWTFSLHNSLNCILLRSIHYHYNVIFKQLVLSH